MHGNIGLEKNEWKVAEDETVIIDPSDRKETPHNWRATFISLSVITFVILAVSAAAYYNDAEDESTFWKRVTYDLHSALDVEASIFINNSASNDQWKTTHWVSDNRLVYFDASGGLSIYHATNNESTILVPADVLFQWRVDEYWPSYDGRYVLLRQPVDDLNSFVVKQEALYAVYDTHEMDLWKLRLKGITSSGFSPEDSSGSSSLAATRLGHAAWLGKSSRLFVVHRNDIYWSDRESDWISSKWLLISDHPHDYDYSIIKVGLPDWTYSEGIGKWKSLVWPSASGQWLLYATLNCSGCHRLDFVNYLADRLAVNSIHYAIPGGPLPEIQLNLVYLDLRRKERRVLLAVDGGHAATYQKERLLVQVKWLDDSNFVTVWMTRNQNQSSIFHCQLSSLTETDETVLCLEIITEEAPENRWLRAPEVHASLDGGFIYISEVDRRLVHYLPPWRKPLRADLGQLIVRRIVGWNEANLATYLLASPAESPQERHLYKVIDKEVVCVTCRMASDTDNCNFIDVNFEPETLNFYELQCLGPRIPCVHVVRVEYGENETAVMTTLRKVDSEGDARELLEHLTPIVRYLTIPLADGSIGRAQVLLPLNWNDKHYHKLRFPLFIRTLDWDEDEALTDQWRKDWASYFTCTRQVIYARVSGRDRRNEYGSIRLGAEDIHTITNAILTEVKHVDGQTIVIIGKGVGGYLATMALARDEERLFKCGIIVSPTIDWYRQETSIAERYLGLLTNDQHEHYVLSRVDEYVQTIKNDSLLLLDSFPQNPVKQFHAMRLNYQMVKAGTRFQQKVYPQASRDAIQYHSYLTLENFIQQCLNQDNL